MRINEIELVGDQDYPLSRVEYYWAISAPVGVLENFNVGYIEDGDIRAILLADQNSQVAAIAVFSPWNNGKVWQARNVQTYSPYKGNMLGGKLYKYVKEKMHKSIQSDTEQSYSGKKLWVDTLPKLGLFPMIFDTKTERIIDPKTSDINVYAEYSRLDPEKFRYTWILEQQDHYPMQNLLTEDSIVMPIQGLWCRYSYTNYKEEK